MVWFQRLLGLVVAAPAVVPLGLLGAQLLPRSLDLFGLDPKGGRKRSAASVGRPAPPCQGAPQGVWGGPPEVSGSPHEKLLR